MTGAVLHVNDTGLDAAMAKLLRVGGFSQSELMDDVAAILESSSRERFETKQDPDGNDWVPWSEAYDETREAHHSLLVSDGDMNDTIAAYGSADAATVGSNLIYFAHHHFGGDDIGSGVPARPVLGVSDQDRGDIHDLVSGTLRDLML